MKKPTGPAVCMQHWNNHQMCAIEVETSGLDPFWDQILQLAIVPLDANLEQRRDVPPFNIYIKPENPTAISSAALRVNKIDIQKVVRFGHDIEKAKDLLEHWVAKLKLGTTKFGNPKRILPLAHNWQFDSSFIKRWLGIEMYGEIFDSRYRDTQVAAEYLNERAAMHAEKVPYSKVNLGWLAKVHGVVNEQAHDAVFDCLTTAEVYRRMTQTGLLG